ncbi:MAG: class I SAM-dependent methyltransferase [Mariprofundaceae bacterium]|nr:class I SAM-dependent methyltransferase [Mariprofundaceae bacterium]
MMVHHKPSSKQRWSASQKAAVARLQEQDLESLHTDAGKRYQAIIGALPKPLPADASILDIGCGPVCTAKLFNSSHTTYLDPLLNNFKRIFPGELPEGEFITTTAEDIPKPDQSYDLILCLNMLSHSLNPELVMHEIRRLLKPEGTLAISITLWPGLLARLHYLKMRLFPMGEYQNRLYCYTQRGIENTLLRHFDILSRQLLETSAPSFSQEWLFLCQHKNRPSDDNRQS